ncbi:MAG: Tetratricopeptide repeat [Planctomycetota bacterium]
MRPMHSISSVVSAVLVAWTPCAWAATGSVAFAARGHQVVPPGVVGDGAEVRGVVEVGAKSAYPDDPRLDIAIRMLSRGAFDAAALTAGTVAAERPEVDRARAVRGIALNKLKQYEEARRELEAALASKQAFPERRHVPHFLGWCCYHLGELEDARKAFEEHLVSTPDEPDSLFGLALVAMGEDRLDDADEAFAKALAGFTREPAKPIDQARVLTRMADLALRRDRVEEAEVLLARAVKASPVLHETWSKVARVKDRLGKTAEADAARANAQRALDALGRGKPAQQATDPAAQAPSRDGGRDSTKPSDPKPSDTKPSDTTPEPRP